jgi:hypothetical protein
MGNTIGATLLGAAALLVMTTPSAAWDYPGHRMVGAIADFVLSSRHPEAYRKIQDLMVSKDADHRAVAGKSPQKDDVKLTDGAPRRMRLADPDQPRLQQMGEPAGPRADSKSRLPSRRAADGDFRAVMTSGQAAVADQADRRYGAAALALNPKLILLLLRVT